MTTTIPLDALRPLYAFVDPARAKNDLAVRRVQARSAVVLVGADELGRVFVLDAWAERVSTDTLIERIYALNARWKPAAIGIEANAMQALFVDAIQRDARLANITLPATPVYQPTKQDKDFRIRSRLQTLIGSGRLFVPRQFKELRLEIENFPMHPTKDCIDALASAVAMLPQTFRPQESEARAVARYLQATGAPGWAIREALERAGLAS